MLSITAKQKKKELEKKKDSQTGVKDSSSVEPMEVDDSSKKDSVAKKDKKKVNNTKLLVCKQYYLYRINRTFFHLHIVLILAFDMIHFILLNE